MEKRPGAASDEFGLVNLNLVEATNISSHVHSIATLAFDFLGHASVRQAGVANGSSNGECHETASDDGLGKCRACRQPSSH
jgi:hypothetical protein